MVPAAFNDINWDAPFDIATYLGIVPQGATIKGMFFRDLVGQCSKVGMNLKVKEDYAGYKDYSLRDYMYLLHEAGQMIYPRLGPRRALRQLGRSVFPTFVESLVGRVMLGVMKTDVVSIVKVANKATAAAMSLGRVDTVKAAPGEAVLHLQDIYFSDSYQVGVFEGVMEATKKRGGKISLNSSSVNDVFMQLVWQD